MQVQFNNVHKLIYLNTLPKSGSVFIWYELAKMLGIPKGRISVTQGTFPLDLVDPERVALAQKQHCVTQAHISPSFKNLIMMECCQVNHVIIHLRDPRQSILSWTHHVDKLKKTNEIQVLKIIEPRIPDGYFDYSLEEKIDFQLDTMFPVFVKWIQDWLNCDQVEGTKAPNLLFTSFEKFKADAQSYFNEIFDFYGLGVAVTDPSKITTPDNGLHYRKGTTNEWQSVYTDAQIEKVNSHLRQYEWPDMSHLGLDLSGEMPSEPSDTTGADNVQDDQPAEEETVKAIKIIENVEAHIAAIKDTLEADVQESIKDDSHLEANAPEVPEAQEVPKAQEVPETQEAPKVTNAPEDAPEEVIHEDVSEASEVSEEETETVLEGSPK